MSNKSPDSEKYVEKRQFERAYFSSEDQVTGIVIVLGREAPIITGNISHLTVGEDSNGLNFGGDISNISLGGVYFVLKKDDAMHVNIDDNLTLKEIQANILCCLELNIEMQVKRIHKYEFVEHVGLGCEFTSISDDALGRIRKLVEWGLNSTSDKRCSIPPS